MKYLVALLLIIPLLLPGIIKADDGCCPGFRPCMSWPSSDNITKFDYPPQLDMVEGYRWRQAMPEAKAKLADMYDVPQDVAILYGAIYHKRLGW